MQDGPWIWGPEDSIPGPRRALDTWLGSGVQWACEEDLCPGGLRAELPQGGLGAGRKGPLPPWQASCGLPGPGKRGPGQLAASLRGLL